MEFLEFFIEKQEGVFHKSLRIQLFFIFWGNMNIWNMNIILKSKKIWLSAAYNFSNQNIIFRFDKLEQGRVGSVGFTWDRVDTLPNFFRYYFLFSFFISLSFLIIFPFETNTARIFHLNDQYKLKIELQRWKSKTVHNYVNLKMKWPTLHLDQILKPSFWVKQNYTTQFCIKIYVQYFI